MLDWVFGLSTETSVELLIATIAAPYAHELGHYVFGSLFGGSPRFRERQWIWPTQVDFDSPDEMSDLGVKITGGYVLIYPAIMAVGAWLHSLPIAAFGLVAGMPISPSDLNALHHPKVWKDLTAGRSVTREDYE